jgi:hypothetical protein
MAEQRQDDFEEEAGPGTQPASFDDMGMDSISTMRPMATQAVFRPHFDDESDSVSAGNGDTEPQEHTTAGGDPAGARQGPSRSPDDQSGSGGVETVLLELRASGRKVDARRPRFV